MAFMESKGSLPCSQDPATILWPEPSSPHPHTLFLQDALAYTNYDTYFSDGNRVHIEV